MANRNIVVLFFGRTGAGKSTLINYLTGHTLVVREGEGNKMILDVDKTLIKDNRVVAPIGHNFFSEPTIPILCHPLYENVTYVDCAE